MLRPFFAFILTCTTSLGQVAIDAPLASVGNDSAMLNSLGVLSGQGLEQSFGLRLFGVFDQSVGRLDVVPDGEGGYDGVDLFGRYFHLITSTSKTSALSSDITMTVWMGVASSPWSTQPVPAVGMVVSSASLGQTRFIPAATLNSGAGLTFMLELAERTTELGPRIAVCALQPQYEGALQQGRLAYGQCADEKMSDLWTGAALCLGGGGLLCLFPPTAIVGCPGMVVCLITSSACSISGHYRAGSRFDSFQECLCVSSANNWDAAGCTFECPSCSLPLLPGGG